MRRIACVITGMLLLFFAHGRGLSPTDSIGFSGNGSICQGNTLVLTANYAPAGASFQWQISTDNGVSFSNIGGATASTYTANATGIYTVIVTTGATPVNWPHVTITVNPNPSANFNFSPNNQCGSAPVNFTNASTGTGLTYLWNFNDPFSGVDSSSTATNPSHHFFGSAANGTQNFNVTLVATNSFGCTSSHSQTVTTVSPSTILSGPSTTTYNGLTYFTQCSPATSATLVFFNTSTTISSNTNYKIVWGDNSPDFVSASFPTANPVSHTYPTGTYNVLYIVSGANNCTDTGLYHVFVGSNPAVGLGNPGNTTICSGDSLTFPISGVSSNPSGTIYNVFFNDGSPVVTYSPAPSSITHVFNLGSCGTNSPGYSNAFSATVTASNPCLTSTASVVPIYVSQKPHMVFSITPSDTVCVNTLVNTANISGTVSDVINGSCINGKSVWSISPSTGWTLVSGSLGTDNGVNNPNVWTTGTNVLSLQFTIPGTYSIKLKGGNQNCGVDSAIRPICVNPTPVAAFSLSNNAGCAPFSITTTNNSNSPGCGANTYQWAVSYSNAAGCTPNSIGYSYVNGTSSTSAQPEFQFTGPGIYTITLITRNSAGICSSTPVSQTVTVKLKPAAVINAPNAICQNGSINPSATVNNCYSTQAVVYSWSFPGGSPSTSTAASPGPIIYFNAGSFTISLTVSNECGSTTVTKTITVNAAPDLTVPPGQTFCAGSATGGFSFSSTVPGTTFTWTNSNTAIGLASSGSGSIPNFIVTNASASPITAIISVTPTNGCAGLTQTFLVTVNPRPLAPVVSSPVIYCQNETSSGLTATGSAGNIITWYNNAALNNGSTTAPVPSTASATTTTWYVTQANSYNCTSPASSIVVTVHPSITGNLVAADQTICTNATAAPLAQQGFISGGNNSFNYQWQQSIDGGLSWTNITGATSAGYSPGTLSNSIEYRRVATSSTCSDTSNVVTITVQGSLGNIGIAADQTICAGTGPALLSGQLPAGGNGTFSYQWESSTDNVNWTPIAGATAQDYQPSPLTTTTYFRRKTISGPCNGYSSSIIITVNPKPVMNLINDVAYCNNTAVSNINFTSVPSANVTYAWTNNNTLIGLAASGNGQPGTFTTTNNSNPKIPLAATISVTPTLTNNSVACTGNALSFQVVVLPTINLSPVPNDTICNGTTIPSFTPTHDAGSFAGSSVSFAWTVSGSGISLSNGTGTTVPSYSTVNSGTTDLIATITITPKYSYANKTCDGIPVSYSIIVKPGTPYASAGLDTALCNAASYIMQAQLPAGTTGVWTQLAGNSAGITTPASPSTSVTGLTPGSYQFLWTVTGFPSCPPSKDTLVITVHPALVNIIDTITHEICYGQTVFLSEPPATGGNGTYQYQWQQSNDGVNWINMSGQTAASLTLSSPVSIYIRRLATSGPCFVASFPIHIIVEPSLTNNIVSADQSICINTIAAIVNGSTPSGGNNLFGYQWQRSLDGGATWTNILGATAQSFSPGLLTQTTKYRRLVSTSLCSGPQGNTSNVITVTVHPNAKAVFSPTDTIKCNPFLITPAIINLQTFPTQNGQYSWYVNNVFIGNGGSFPGYTISNENDSVTIKLVAISSFGCLSDSISHQFHTYRLPHPAFTVSDTLGCGPLTVQINNITPNINLYNYQWNFGNGQTSTLAQPGNVIFLPNPNFGDTTYIVKLSVASPCDTIIVSKPIHVKSKPKALFTPNNSVGCSPMTVTFNNNSLGLGNSYTWNFGDGSGTTSTNATGTITHTFYAGVQDTFYVKLVAVNGCGSDSLIYAIVVSPNQVHLDFAINGNQFSGCSPHTVKFINNSSGASLFTWNFGDNNIISTTLNIDTVTHTYLSPGTYLITLHATNGCSDTTSTETIVVYPKPTAAFIANQYTACIGDSINFSNQSAGATSYLWQFGDNNTSTLTSPSHIYPLPGLYTVKLMAFSFNAPGTVCTDSVTHQVQIVSSLPGSFTASDTLGYCAPFTVNFVNQNIPSVTASWDFGDNSSGSGNSLSHTYTHAGIFTVHLTVTVPGGCTYNTIRTVKVLGPSGSWTHTTGYLCNNNAASFQVLASNTDSLVYSFGDGVVTTTTNNFVSHSYTNAGIYFPSVILKNTAGCLVFLPGTDSIRVDKIKAGFTSSQQHFCGSTSVNFTDTSHTFFGKSLVKWNFGDGNTGTGITTSHNYNTTGTYPVQLIVIGTSGCSDTITRAVTITVNSKPSASILSDTVVCERYPVSFTSTIQSTDAINIIQWNLSNGVSNTSPSFSYSFAQAGNYSIRLIAGTVNGCYDTTARNIKVNPTPTVTASNDLNLCRGNSTPLSANGTGVTQWSWSPLQGLSCYTCPNPVASPLITTPYLVQGTNSFGCSAYDTVVVTVIQPLHLNISSADSICIGGSTNLLVSGGTNYSWSPATGLNNTTIPNPTASPAVTTNYRVVGYDGYNCFTDTAFVLVAVGQYPIVNLGPDLVLPTGNLHPLSSSIQNGPVITWLWTPSTDLSCSNCALPIANIKKDISYAVKVTNNYGCSASDSINIKTFCESAQVFIPNAFTPDGDGYNDILMVRASGIALVRSFRVFNRWGEAVFEKGNCPPNDPAYGWDGKIKGVAGPPDVYVYTAEVICENGTSYVYKGNVTILK